MKILWVNPHFLHPCTKGGQIRTLEMLRYLHGWHEVHYATLENPEEPEGRERSKEYCAKVFSIVHAPPNRRSVKFVAQAAGNLFSNLPLAVSRYASMELRRKIDSLLETEKYDRVVCDFLFAAPNVSRLDKSILFQHNVETTIWQRHLETTTNPAMRAFLRVQAGRMFRYEKEVCRTSRHVVAVSDTDALRIKEMFGVDSVSSVPTGVDLEYFDPPEVLAPETDLVFVGSMDWLPNIDGMRYFAAEILPLIRREKPDCTVRIVGRRPPREIQALAENDPKIKVTGTVPDIRSHLWRSAVSIVPLRIGGGTRLKIFESMAGRVPVVSTPIGAEGLPLHSGEDCFLAESPAEFAARCLELLADADRRRSMAAAAWTLVSEQFSWKHAARCFEQILVDTP
ncbi:MAG TPA: glycosyltransferase family 4 protein [Bryobacteraceae bacterium]|jgi:glycosyltransferase involved in cell wall biosynthesis|nr:glycosyltransferase family 4 protein [Bryobacteraceae bacterium]